MFRKKFLDLFRSISIDECLPLISLILAASVCYSTIFLCAEVNHVNDESFGHVTILDESPLLNALRDAQTKGVIMGIQGSEHENYTTLTPIQAKENVEKAKRVFEKAGLFPSVFISNYDKSGITEIPSVRKAIESANIPTQLPALEHAGDLTYINEYTQNWSTMNSSSDPRFQAASEMIRAEKPETILLHASDWNVYTKKFLENYLLSTEERNITIRMDDIELNTPKEVINNISQMTKYKSVGRIILAVLPMGIWTDGDPTVKGIKVNNLLAFCYWFFILTALLPLSFYIIWKLLSEWNLKNIKNNYLTSNNKDIDYPGLVSIIVPAYNEEKSIGKCLESMLVQDYPGKMEIIAVNDGSSDRTSEIISKYAVKFIDLKVNLGKANALNIAIEESKGDILIFTDSDSYMDKSAVSSLVKCFNENLDVQIVAGNVFINNDQEKKPPLIKYFQMIEYVIEQEVLRYLQGLKGHVLVCPGPLTAFRKSVFDKIQYSDETIIEDFDITVKALKHSMKIIRDPEAKVYTNVPETITDWYKQRRRWGYGNLQVWRLHKHWSIRDPWMVLNYLGYINGIVSIMLFISLPYLLLQYDNLQWIFLRGLPFTIVPLLIFALFISPFLIEDKKLLPFLIPYLLIYPTMRSVIHSYFYICYISGRGLNVQWGSKNIHLK